MIRRMRILDSGIVGTIALIAIPLLLVSAGSGARAEGESLKYRTFGTEEFQSFVKNWDDTKHPVLYALIRSPREWDLVFHPAPVMGKNRPFGPERTLYEKEQILLVARTMPMPAGGGLKEVFQAEAVAANGDQLVLRYRFRNAKQEASFTVKNYLGVVIPKRDCKEVVFVENGVPVGVLNVAKGQWSVPEMARENASPKKGKLNFLKGQ